jgi:hypothetical protein
MRKFIIWYCDTLFPYRWSIVLLFIVLSWVILDMLYVLGETRISVIAATLTPIFYLIVDIVLGLGMKSPLDTYIESSKVLPLVDDKEDPLMKQIASWWSRPNPSTYSYFNEPPILTPVADNEHDVFRASIKHIEDAKYKEISNLFAEALMCRRSRHKQWYIEEIARKLNIKHGLCENEYDKGIAP